MTEAEISKLKQTHEFEVNHLAHANMAWQRKCEELTDLPKYDINKLPNGNTYISPERILCAANQYEDRTGKKVVIAGVRHACSVMVSAYLKIRDEVHRESEIQGFLTTKYRFVNRQEAWKIAAEQQQIVCRVGGDTSKGGTLYSENLY